MTLKNATTAAQNEATKHGLHLVVVLEGLHADEFAERDTNGESYGFCPPDAVPYLYKYGKVVEYIKP